MRVMSFLQLIANYAMSFWQATKSCGTFFWDAIPSIVEPARIDWRVTLFVIIVLAALVWNGIKRTRWDLARNASGSGNKRIPERRLTYDAKDLKDFVQASKGNVLPLYISILRGSDIGFAIALAAITVWLWYRIAVTPMGCTFLNWLALPLGAMAILYGIADVAEDLKLSSILSQPQAIDRAEAAAASTLTRIKFVTLFLSAIGAAIFVAYLIVQTCATWLLRPRGTPATT